MNSNQTIKQGVITDKHYDEIVDAFGKELADKFMSSDYATFMDFFAMEVM